MRKPVALYLYIHIHASLQKHERVRRYIFLYTHPCLLVQTCIWWLQRRRTVNNIMVVYADPEKVPSTTFPMVLSRG